MQDSASSTMAHDAQKRALLRALGVAGLGIVGISLFPKKASALVMGGSPSTSVVGVKNASNTRVNPATEETLSASIAGQAVAKYTTALTGSGTVVAPSSGKRLRIYNSRFSLSADMTSVSFRFASGGTDYEVYLSPKAGGLYGANNQPNYVQGGIDEVLHCALVGTGTIQINIDYLEV